MHGSQKPMDAERTVHHYTIASPIGPLLLIGDADALQGVHFQGGPHPYKPRAEWRAGDKPFREVVRQLKAYFDGRLKAFDLPLAPRGTEFQMQVWRLLRTIPYGRTWSYGEIARRLGRPEASRAVGAANGQNPIPVIIPCHRVIGSDGSLTGFGGGLPIKRKLLALEGALPAAEKQSKLF